MNNPTVEQFTNAHKANLDTLYGLSQSAFEGVEKVVALNLQASKAAMTEATDAAKAVLGVKDVQSLFALQQSLLQPAAEKALAYGRHVYEIAAQTNAEVVRVAEEQFADLQQKVVGAVDSVVDNAVKNAPAGSESVVALMRSAVTTASNAVESVQKATRQAAKQAASVAEANLQAFTKTAESSVKAVSGRGKRAA